jgi:hypothetical protein
MIWVINAGKANGMYEIQLEFNNGTKGVIDFKKILENDHRQIVRELLNIDEFNSFTVENDTICWKNGVDFCPDFLYEMMLKHKQVA